MPLFQSDINLEQIVAIALLASEQKLQWKIPSTAKKHKLLKKSPPDSISL